MGSLENKVSKVGLIGGMAVFGIGFIIVIIAIFVDMRKDGIKYDAEIRDDLDKLKKMGLEDKIPEFKAELAIRLKGKKEDEGVDDQLFGEAFKLTPAQYEEYM